MHGSAFLYIGADGESFPLTVPYPTVGAAAFDAQAQLATTTNANGRLVGQLRGKTRVSQSVGWSSIGAPEWWTMCRWFDKNGPFCYVRHFSHLHGEWRVGRFVCTQFTAQVGLVGDDGTPERYDDASFTLQSTGG